MQVNTRIKPQAQDNPEVGFSTIRAAPNFYQVGGGVRVQEKIFGFPSKREMHPNH
jgi:hypothetical protein